MKKWLVLSVIVIVIASFTTITNKKENNDPEAIKKAINKSLPLLQTTSHAFLENAKAHTGWILFWHVVPVPALIQLPVYR